LAKSRQWCSHGTSGMLLKAATWSRRTRFHKTNCAERGMACF
jgi:predicted RNA-binding Zn ribbon-like protein